MNKHLPFEPWLVGALALAAVVYEPCLPYAVLGALLLRLLFWVGGWPLSPDRIHLPIMLLLVMVGVSVLVTPLPATTALQALRVLLGVLLFLSLTMGLKNKYWLGITLTGIPLLTVALAIGGLFFVNWADKYNFLPQLSKILPRIPAILDTAMNPNIAGAFLAILLIGLFAWMVFRWSSLHWLLRLSSVLIVVLVGVVLLLTQARTASLALAAGGALMLVLRWRHGWIVVALGMAAALVVVYYIGLQKAWYALGAATGGVDTFILREDIWLRSKLIIQDFPLTGIGMGTFNEVVGAFYPLSALIPPMAHTHNLFLQLSVDLGLPGLLAWLGCWGGVLWSAGRLFSSKPVHWRAIGAAAMCCQLTLAVGGLFDCAVWDNRPAIIIWGLWGLILAADRIRRTTDVSASQESPPQADSLT